MWLPAVLLALTVMSHLVVAIFAVVCAVVIWLVFRPLRNVDPARGDRRGGCAAHRVLARCPLAVNLGNTTDMRYEPIGDYLDWMFLSENWFLYPFAALAIGAGHLVPPPRDARSSSRSPSATGLVFYHWEGLRELLGKAPAWNLRLLPFWYLMLFLLAGAGCGRAGAARRPRRRLGRARRREPLGDRRDAAGRRRSTTIDDRGPTVGASRRGCHGTRPGHRDRGAGGDRDDRRARARAATTRDFLPYWARYNYTGYESGTAETSPRSRGPSTARSSTPRTPSRRVACCGRAATPSARTARRSR